MQALLIVMPLLLTGLLLSGIAAVQAAHWPRQITDSRGTHTLESQPKPIVSTSVTLTGSLLAIDAPVIASGATTPNNRVADDQGFLRQWNKGLRKNANCNGSISANRVQKPLPRKCRI
ncbi:hypothetical protein ACLK2I_03255 [Escherichia coli]